MHEDFDTQLRLDELDPEMPQPVDTPWGSFSLFHVEGEWKAWQSFCPHMQAPLFGGSRTEDSVTCPWHLWRYSLRTGEFLDAPEDDVAADRGCLASATVRVGPRGTIVLGFVGEPDDLRGGIEDARVD